MSQVDLRTKTSDDWQDQNGNRIVGLPKLLGPAFIEFTGSNNSLTFSSGSSFAGYMSFRRDDSHVAFGNNAMYRGRMSLGLGCSITFGRGIYWGPNGYITTAERANITFGDDLLVSENCSVRADDSHPIYNGLTGERINPSKDIVVGSHVWIGADALLMPGSVVGSGSVLGARSMVTPSRPVPPNSLVVGSPIRVVRENIYWVRKHLQSSTDIDDSIEPVAMFTR